MLWPKINSYKEFNEKIMNNEKKFLQLENSPPPNNFSNNPSLIKDNPSVQSTVKVLLNKN